MPKETVAIGIDLGTTKCCVGVVIKGKVEILENEHGKTLTPSYVTFTDTERLVGAAANSKVVSNPNNTLFGTKRIMGRTLDDPFLKQMATNVPYTICNGNGETCISVTYKKKFELLIPQQVSAALLSKMKELAEARLDCQIEKAVISVPGCFTNSQRQATKDAATIAGLNVLALVNGSTAAAITYKANRNEQVEETIAVLDFGGGKVDVSIAVVSSDGVNVKAVSGSTEIGGTDLDEALMNHFIGKFKEKFRRDLLKDDSIRERVRASCEKLKQAVTFSQVAQDQWNFVDDDNIFRALLRRDVFNEIVFSKIIPSLKDCLNCALKVSGIGKDKISRVVLVGGSSRIPLIQEAVKKFFSSSLLDTSLNPEEAVAQGTAIYAAYLSGTDAVKLNVSDILPNAFFMTKKGSEDPELLFDASKITIPTTKDLFLRDRTVLTKCTIYEKDSGRQDLTKLIGTLCLSEEFARAAYLVTSVTFEIDECGLFDVAAHLKPDHVIRDIMKKNAYKLSDDRLKKGKAREEEFKKDILSEEQRLFALADLESICCKINDMAQRCELEQLFPDIMNQIKTEISKTMDWLEETKNVTTCACNTKLELLVGYEKLLRKHIKQAGKQKKKSSVIEVMNKVHVSKSHSTRKKSCTVREDLTVEINNSEHASRCDHFAASASERKDDKVGKPPAKLCQIFQRKLEFQQKEKDRMSAVNNLWEYCLDLRSMMLSFQASEQDQDLVNQLIDQSKSVTMWLSSSDACSATECEEKKAYLVKLLLNIEDRHCRKVARQREEERAAAVKNLKTCCQELGSFLFSFEHMLDSEVINQVSEKISLALRWLGDMKLPPISVCEEKKLELENLKSTLQEAMQEQQLTQR